MCVYKRFYSTTIHIENKKDKKLLIQVFRQLYSEMAYIETIDGIFCGTGKGNK